MLTQHLKALQNAVAILNWAELSGNVTLANVVAAIQLCERVRRAEQELDRYRIELGAQAQSLQYVIPELTSEIESGLLIIKDYYHARLPDASDAFEAILGLDAQSLTDQRNIGEALGYSRDVRDTFEIIEPRGYRMLSRVPRIPFSIIENIVHKFKTLDRVNTAVVGELQVVEGVGKARASAIKNALAHMKSTSVQPEVLALSVFD